MIKQRGFTLIELIIFIVVTAVLGLTVFMAANNALLNLSKTLYQTVASETARQCMEYYIGQRRLNGYNTLDGANCTSPLTLPSLCSAPSGYTLVANCINTSISGDNNYNTITVSVTGQGGANLTYLIGRY
jgi:type II secretory pathway pseudopilin PulG